MKVGSSAASAVQHTYGLGAANRRRTGQGRRVMTAPLMTGEIVFAEPPRHRGRAVVRVRLSDVTRLDTESVTLAEQEIHDVELEPGRPLRVPFALYAPDPDPRARCVVEAHVDLTGDGEIKPGDFVSMGGHPVLTRGHGRTVTVEVREVS